MTPADAIRERGPLTVAAFMDLALYDPRHGYYAGAAQRSGRAGDFFTSVDVGSLFGELLSIQIAEMLSLLSLRGGASPAALDLVEAGAGNGRLSADVVNTLRVQHPAMYSSLRLSLVEASERARHRQREVLGDVADRLHASTASMPSSIDGIVFANELLDAMPVHQVVMRGDGLREVYVDLAGSTQDRDALRTIEGPPSTPALHAYLDRLGVVLEPGWRVEINLRAVEWIDDVARRLSRGFVILIDYGHEARELYSVTHATGTLTTFTSHRSVGPEADRPVWLDRPGEQDITAHVDFTSVRVAAESAGLTTLAFLDQTYFLLGLASQLDEWHDRTSISDATARRARALKTLVMPGGLGSTMKVLILGKNAGAPKLLGASFSQRVT